MFHLASCIVLSVVAAAGAIPGEEGRWQGFDTRTFSVGDTTVHAALPAKPAEGLPWVLLAGEEPTPTDAVLLAEGFHIVWADLPDRFGSPASVRAWDAVYEAMTDTHGLSKKPVLEGNGVHGLQVYNWAARNVGAVSCIYCDTPVMDFNSWPGGAGKSEGDPDAWSALKEAYGFASDDEAKASKDTPLGHVEAISEAKTDILHTVAERDKVIPFKENTGPFRNEYHRIARKLMFIVEREGDETLGGLEEPLAVAYFICNHALHGGRPPETAPSELGSWKATDFARPGHLYKWRGAIFMERGQDMTGVNWTGYIPESPYEITVECMRVDGSDFFCGLTFPYEDSACTLVLGGWGGTVSGISCIDHNDAANNQTTKYMEFETGRWYAIRVRVTKNHIQAWVDDEQIVDVEPGDSIIDVRWEVEASKPLGIATWQTTGAFRGFDIRALSSLE